jgi:recombinational DNA repair ATPase RecF
MNILEFKVENYKSWYDSGVVAISPGFNIIIGQNNVGKSALLEALSFTTSPNPHRSLVTCPSVHSVLEAPIKLTISGRGKLTTCFAGEDLCVHVC